MKRLCAVFLLVNAILGLAPPIYAATPGSAAATTYLEATVDALLRNQLVYVDPTAGVDPAMAQRLTQRLRQGDNLRIAVLPEAASKETGGAANFAQQAGKDAGGQLILVVAFVGPKSEIAATSNPRLFPPDVATRLAGQAHPERQGVEKALQDFVDKVHAYQAAHHGGATPSGAQPPSSILTSILVADVVLFLVGGFWLIRRRRRAGTLTPNGPTTTSLGNGAPSVGPREGSRSPNTDPPRPPALETPPTAQPPREAPVSEVPVGPAMSAGEPSSPASEAPPDHPPVQGQDLTLPDPEDIPTKRWNPSFAAKIGKPLLPTDPRQIGAYEIKRRLGAGGMGTVYLGEAETGSLVAIKVMNPMDEEKNSDFRERFKKEIVHAQRVTSPYTAPVIAAEPTGEQPWLATEFIDAPNLSEFVTATSRFTPDELKKLMLGLAYALMDIHIHGLVHRDLKPSNVLRTPEGHPCVIDFGIAYELGSTRRTQGLIGTPAYAAPELLLGRPITPAADVFSLGGIIVFAASGHQPFGGEHYGQIIQSVINDPPKSRWGSR